MLKALLIFSLLCLIEGTLPAIEVEAVCQLNKLKPNNTMCEQNSICTENGIKCIGGIVSSFVSEIIYDHFLLAGTVPTTVGNLVGLKKLILSKNKLNGTIPTQLANLSALEILDLSNNQLGGTIPSQIANLTNLLTLNLVGNNVSGSLPIQLANMTDLMIDVDETIECPKLNFVPRNDFYFRRCYGPVQILLPGFVYTNGNYNYENSSLVVTDSLVVSNASLIIGNLTILQNAKIVINGTITVKGNILFPTQSNLEIQSVESNITSKCITIPTASILNIIWSSESVLFRQTLIHYSNCSSADEFSKILVDNQCINVNQFKLEVFMSYLYDCDSSSQSYLNLMLLIICLIMFLII